MAYATAANVAKITGKLVAEIDAYFTSLADREVERILGRTFNKVTGEIDYFDVEERNVFLSGDVGYRGFPLCKWPVLAVSKVETIYRTTDGVHAGIETPSTLLLDDQYFLEIQPQGTVVKIASDVELYTGVKSLKVTYDWGFEAVPNDIKDFADWIAAKIIDLNTAVPTNDDGAPLQEWEVGRYRERYANPIQIYAGKYGTMLKSMEESLTTKYKLWD